jgi:hypothetical protein
MHTFEGQHRRCFDASTQLSRGGVLRFAVYVSYLSRGLREKCIGNKAESDSQRRHFLAYLEFPDSTDYESSSGLGRQTGGRNSLHDSNRERKDANPSERQADSSSLVGNSVENHLLQGYVREFYAGALLAAVIWTL